MCSACVARLEPNPVEHCEGARLIAPYRYAGSIRKAIHRMKYEERSDFVQPLVQLAFAMRPDAVSPTALLVPVPLHPERLVSRGYNQSMLLATAMAQAWRLRVRGDLLLRSVATKPQVGQSRRERAANLESAFSVPRKPSSLGSEIWVVDDVVTTGATFSSCRRALLAAGYSVGGIIAIAHANSDEYRSAAEQAGISEAVSNSGTPP
jgi:ComF family protein